MDSKYPQRNTNSSEESYNIWETLYSLKTEEYVLDHYKVV